MRVLVALVIPQRAGRVGRPEEGGDTGFGGGFGGLEEVDPKRKGGPLSIAGAP